MVLGAASTRIRAHSIPLGAMNYMPNIPNIILQIILSLMTHATLNSKNVEEDTPDYWAK